PGSPHCLSMPSEDTQFKRDNLPSRKGLPANTKPVAEKPIGVRFYAEDMEPLNAMKDRSGFIRDAVHKALQNESNHNPA
ncbi:MAG: hypothetical protein ACO3NZ_16015, partial [Pirellulales bacterium]